jgi:hypothetical protein
MKLDLLACLSRDELRAVATRVGVAVDATSAEGELIDAILNSRRVTLSEIVPVLSRVRREEVCHALGLVGGAPEGCIVAE